MEHLLRTHGKQADFLAGFEERKFRRTHQARANEVQAGVFFFIGILRLDHAAHELFDVLDEPNLEERVRDVECGVERGEHHGNLREVSGIAFVARTDAKIKADHMANGAEEPLEHNHHPNHTDNVNREVSESGTAGLRIGRECHNVCRNRRTDVFAKHKHNALVNMQNAG